MRMDPITGLQFLESTRFSISERATLAPEIFRTNNAEI